MNLIESVLFERGGALFRYDAPVNETKITEMNENCDPSLRLSHFKFRTSTANVGT